MCIICILHANIDVPCRINVNKTDLTGIRIYTRTFGQLLVGEVLFLCIIKKKRYNHNNNSYSLLLICHKTLEANPRHKSPHNNSLQPLLESTFDTKPAVSARKTTSQRNKHLLVVIHNTNVLLSHKPAYIMYIT